MIVSSHLSISHIAWPPDREEELLDKALELGVKTVELAPLRAFGDPLCADEKAVRAKAEWYAGRGFRIGSFQALLFGADGVFLFDDQASRLRMKEWLIAVGQVAGWCGAGPMVFGSPKNRLKGSRSHAEAMKIATEFFREVGDACHQAGSCLVMEANPEAYGADFCTRMDQAADLVTAVSSPGFRLHVDAGGLALSGENFEPVIAQASHLIAHAHASQPNLGPWDEPDPVHQRVADALDKAGYRGDVAIEMKAQEDIVPSVGLAIRKTRECYRIPE
ncbi:sugar phosphate isomerase/epimerase [Luteolibacter ambystomatis]|uniref:Sugar phosphate isomerase/epimerase n=1 Tax=Luteolibacter ambystomatis TaxID=2824561 RepID=A0A975G6Y1_9BACT|nr:sugar phosphate isomerase/epimerase [Luteolibacter ambystomatis]QUE50214.1 sugar phosphate isomerase/epimerase [Luteolibacter ambystomatis]